MNKQIIALTVFFSALFLSYSLYARPEGMTAQEYSLYKAAYMGRLKKVQRLLEKGVNPNTKSPNSQRTPLHIACSKGRLSIVECLLEKGADVDAKNIEGKTPLEFAAKKGYMKIVEHLVEKGAQITRVIIDKASKEKIKKYLQSKMNRTSRFH